MAWQLEEQSCYLLKLPIMKKEKIWFWRWLVSGLWGDQELRNVFYYTFKWRWGIWFNMNLKFRGNIQVHYIHFGFLLATYRKYLSTRRWEKEEGRCKNWSLKHSDFLKVFKTRYDEVWEVEGRRGFSHRVIKKKTKAKGILRRGGVQKPNSPLLCKLSLNSPECF